MTTYYLLGEIGTETYNAFGTRIMDFCTEYKRYPGIGQLKVSLTTARPPMLSVIPFKRRKIAAVQIKWADGVDPQPLIHDGLLGSYRVHEDLPVSYERTWPVTTATPGACLLTLFRQKKSITRDDFLDRWHNGHTPLSLRIHPLWHYSRNVVEELLSNDSEQWDGIVEEHTRTRSALLNPFRFFGNPITIFRNMLRVYFDVRSFLDYGSVEPYLVTEYYIK